MTGEAVNAASMAFKMALVGALRALSSATLTHIREDRPRYKSQKLSRWRSRLCLPTASI